MDDVEKTSVFGTAVHAVMRGSGSGPSGTLHSRLAAAGVPARRIDRSNRRSRTSSSIGVRGRALM
jgi:hypothetical protein